jgi:hypothetical protein
MYYVFLTRNIIRNKSLLKIGNNKKSQKWGSFLFLDATGNFFCHIAEACQV